MQPNLLTFIESSSAFNRLKEVSTMIFPYNVFINRYSHTHQVLECALEMSNKLGVKYPLLEECCLLHDIGHCCFAHEGEEIFDDFISKHLFIDKDRVGFGHGINGTIVFLDLLKKNEKEEQICRDLLYKNNDDFSVLIDCIAKHSINPKKLNGIYFEYVYDRLLERYGRKLKFAKQVDPFYEVSSFVIVADDFATKNSDPIDLFHMYLTDEYNSLIKNNLPLNRNFIIRDFYINKMSDLYMEHQKLFPCSPFDIVRAMKSIPSYQGEKSFLETTYRWKYKDMITKYARVVESELLEIVFKDAYILKRTGYGKKLGAIINEFRKAFEREFGKHNVLPKDYNIKLIVTRYGENPNNTNPYYNVLKNYLCSIVYEFSCLTEKILFELAYKIESIKPFLSPEAKNCLKILVDISNNDKEFKNYL